MRQRERERDVVKNRVEGRDRAGQQHLRCEKRLLAALIEGRTMTQARPWRRWTATEKQAQRQPRQEQTL